MTGIELRKVKQGDSFKRKPNAYKEYIREHYNRKSMWGPAGFCCSDCDDIGRSITLKSSTIVYV